MGDISPIILALIGTGLACLSTILGASLVFFIKGEINFKFHKLFIGFAAGVMVAAAIFALIIPAFEIAFDLGLNGWFPVAIGFILGGLFLFGLDFILKNRSKVKNQSESRGIILSSAMALHNIPEGLAVGLILGTSTSENQTYAMAAATILTIGMILHNLPEGAAISLPLRNQGYSKKTSFLYGAISGVFEPIAGVLGVILVGSIETMMPVLLGFAAGAMIYVVVQELIPEVHKGKSSHLGTLGAMSGFIMMMLLDIIFH